MTGRDAQSKFGSRVVPGRALIALAGFVAAWDLFRDPVLCAIIAGATLGFLGVYVVLRRMVFVTVAVTQASALGVALAFFADIHLGWAVDPIAGAMSCASFGKCCTSSPRGSARRWDGRSNISIPSAGAGQ